MTDLEQNLRDALASTAAVAVDEQRLRAGAERRLAARQARRVAIGVAAGVAVVAGAIVLTTRTVEPHAKSVAATADHRPPQARRPVFARFRESPPLRPAARLSAEIADLRAALARPASDAEHGDQLFQLGEAYDGLRELASPGSDPRKQAAAAALENLRALYDGAQYRQHPARDGALFDAAYLLYVENRVPESQVLFQRLLDEHPRSAHAPEAAVARAEAFFEAGDLEQALDYYQRVLEYPDSPLIGYALYKIGWAHINRQEADAAATAFERVLDLHAQGKLAGPDNALLVAECHTALARLRAKRK